MPDVKLGTIELILAKGKGGQKALSFSHALDEPGEPGRAGTLVFDNLHHGLGGLLAREADRYVPPGSALDQSAARHAWAATPGIVAASGSAEDEVESSGAAKDIGPVEFTYPWTGGLMGPYGGGLYPNVFTHGGKAYVVTPTKAYEVDPTTGQWTLKHTVTSPNLMGGRVVFYEGIWWIGLFDNTAKLTNGVLKFDGTTWTEEIAEGDAHVGYMTVAHGGLFGLFRFLVLTPWWLFFTDSNAPQAYANWVGMAGPIMVNPTALHAMGRYILVFASDGSILAIGDAPPIKTLLAAGAITHDDPRFGHGATMWGSDLVFTTEDGGVYALNIDRLATRNIHPVAVQGRIEGRQFQPTGLGQWGADLVVGTKADPVLSNKHGMMTLANFPDGLAYNLFASQGVNIAGYRVYGATPVYGAYNRIYYVYGNDASGRIGMSQMPSSVGGAPVTPTESYLYTSHSYGEFTGRKLVTQVRGWNRAALTNDIQIWLVADTDYTGLTSAGTTKTKGPFTMTGARLVGSAFGLKVKLPTDAVWPQLILPLMVDYVEEPRSGERIQLAAQIPTGVRRMDSGNEAVETYVASLLALVDGVTKTLTFYDVAGTPSSFTVLVETVEAAQNVVKIAREYPDAAAVITARVV